MAGDDQLTPSEERAAAALARTLRRTSVEGPVDLDVESWIATTPRRATFSLRARTGFALAVVGVLVVAAAAVVAPRAIGPATTSAPTPNVQHFDNGRFRFEYPADWRDLSDDPDQVVLGTGTYCSGMPSSGCADATTGIGGGQVVLRVWTADAGAPGYCASDARGDVSRKFVEDALHADQPTTRWEIRRPGFLFGMGGNAWVEAVTANATEVARAQSLVNSFGWDADYCATASEPPTIPGTVGHFDNGVFSFDYPTGWQALSPGFDNFVERTEAVLGTGSWHTGCVREDNGYGCTADWADVSDGRVVVKVIERTGGPAPRCESEPTPNATLGPNAVLVTANQDGSTTWELHPAGGRFGWPGNVQIMAWTDGAEARAQVKALVASVRWADSTISTQQCVGPTSAVTPTPGGPAAPTHAASLEPSPTR